MDQQNLSDLRVLFEQFSTAADGVSNMRAALHLSLLISPIFLLVPIQLNKKSYNRNTMLSISTCLGNSKPQLLFDVEREIWKTLFSLASGTFQPFDLLRQLSDNLPWDFIETASDDVTGWFDLRKSNMYIPIY